MSAIQEHFRRHVSLCGPHLRRLNEAFVSAERLYLGRVQDELGRPRDGGASPPLQIAPMPGEEPRPLPNADMVIAERDVFTKAYSISIYYTTLQAVHNRELKPSAVLAGHNYEPQRERIPTVPINNKKNSGFPFLFEYSGFFQIKPR